MRLDGTTAVVTGASSGMGKAMATAFVEEGANVVFSSYEPGPLDDAVAAADGPGDAAAVTADVREWDDVRRLVEEATEAYGPIDVFVNNAGITQFHTGDDSVRHPVVDVSVEAWDTVLETNLRGPFLCSKAALPGMLDRDAGRLLHVTSGHGLHGRATHAPYAASKFGLEGFHESLALELEETGVDSIAFRPPQGGVYSERYGALGRTPESFGHETPRIISETAVRLAAGEGENGGRYVATDDGEDYTEYTRC